MSIFRSLLPILILFLILALTNTVKLPDPLSRLRTCPVKLPDLSDEPQGRVVGGKAPSAFTRSHFISFHEEGCGASLISSRWAITASHCAVHVESSATFGGTLSNNGFLIPIKAVYQHPSFDFPKNDITLIEFAQDVPSTANFFAVNTNPSIPALGEFARVAGYGYTSETDNQNDPSEIFQVDIPIVLTSVCKADFEAAESSLAPNIVDAVHLCAGYADGNCDGCTGDSGGPLYVYKGKRLIQIAVVSFGLGCARPNMPGGYTRLSTFIEWMRSVGAKFEEIDERDPIFLKGFGPDSTTAPTTTIVLPTTTAPNTNTPSTATVTTTSTSVFTETAVTSTTTTSTDSSTVPGIPSTDPPKTTESSGTKPTSTHAQPSASPTAGVSSGSPTTTTSAPPVTSNPSTTNSGGSTTVAPAPSGGGGNSPNPSTPEPSDELSESDSTANSSGNGSGKSDGGNGVKVGAAVGGSLGVALIAAVIGFFVVRQRRASSVEESVAPTVETSVA